MTALIDLAFLVVFYGTALAGGALCALGAVLIARRRSPVRAWLARRHHGR